MECLSHFYRVIGSIRMREIVSFALCATVCVWICRSIRKTARWTRSESSSCFACTRMQLAQRTVRAVLCGDGTRIERNRSAETCKLLVYRWCESSLVPSVFHRSKSRFLSKMIKYGAHEMNRLNSIRE